VFKKEKSADLIY